MVQAASLVHPKLRRLKPAAAWRESGRRAIAVGIVGFFAFGTLQSLGVPILLKPAQAAIAGMTAAFLTYLAVSVAYYHHSWIMGSSLSVVLLSLPFVVVALWSRFSNQPLLIPAAIMALAGYLGLKRIHIAASRQLADDYFIDLVQADETEFHPKSRWASALLWAMIVLGGMMILALLR